MRSSSPSRWFAALALLVVGFVGVAGPARGAASPARDRWVIGYYPGYERALLPPSEIDWSALTHLAVGAVLPRPDGSLDTTFFIDRTKGPRLAKHLAALAAAHDVVPLLMVGGAGAHDGFAAAAKHHRGALVRHLLRVMRGYGFRGLDLDWEPVQNDDRVAVAALVKALRSRAPHAVLTMPVGWVTTTFPDVPAFYGRLATRLDRVNVMTYGMAGAYPGWDTWHSSALRGAGSSTPSDVAVNVASYEKAGVPAAKLGIGIGFYGTCWAGGVTGPRQPVGSSYVAADDGVMSFTAIMSTYYSSAAYHYDTDAQAPYLSFAQPTGPPGCTYVSYENERSVTAKGAYAERHGLGAEIVWSINQGHVSGAPDGQTDPLLEAVRSAFH